MPKIIYKLERNLILLKCIHQMNLHWLYLHVVLHVYIDQYWIWHAVLLALKKFGLFTDLNSCIFMFQFKSYVYISSTSKLFH